MRSPVLTAIGLALVLAIPAAAIDRAEVMDRARAFAGHPWHCSASNLQASCLTGYQSEYVEGDHMGLPYDWGGFVMLHRFDLDIDEGEGAGSPAGGEVAACTTGLDCSGYVSACWDTGQKYGTWTIGDISSVIDLSELQPGDALNEPGYHIVIYGDTLSDGTLLYYEAMPPNVRRNWFASWAGVAGFEAIRLDSIESGGSDLGSLSNPIPIDRWPYEDSRDTTRAPADLFDACGAAPDTDESGREFVYVFTVDTPGILTASVSDGIGVDIDLHLYANAAERDCIARHDTTLDLPLTGCGDYYLVLDTWVDAGGVELPGPYTLTADFSHSGGECQPRPSYDFLGGPGEPCAYPGGPALPFCNPNLGVVTCLYSSGADPFSFCSRPCAHAVDCSGDFPAGCCEPVQGGDLYCFPAGYCPADEPDGGLEDGGEEDGEGDGGDGWDAGGTDDGGPPDGSPADPGADPGPGDPDEDRTDGGDEQSPCPEGYRPYGEGCVPDEWEPEADGCGCSPLGARAGGMTWLLLALLVLSLRRIP